MNDDAKVPWNVIKLCTTLVRDRFVDYEHHGPITNQPICDVCGRVYLWRNKVKPWEQYQKYENPFDMAFLRPIKSKIRCAL